MMQYRALLRKQFFLISILGGFNSFLKLSNQKLLVYVYVWPYPNL